MLKKPFPIDTAVSILKQSIKKFEEPVTGKLARKTRDPFLVLVSCVLSARTKDAATREAGDSLFAVAKTPQAIAALGTARLEKLIYPVGFYKTKARHLKEMCRRLMKEYGGRVPDSIEELLTLSGVGRKTANLVVTLAFRKPGICVDIHVHRISNRFGYVNTKMPEQTEWVLREKLPKKYWMIWNDLLVPFGQNLCQPVSPWCSRCDLRPYCPRKGVVRSR